MNEKYDYAKEEKELYLPKKEPAIINVPAMPFIMIDGSGDPNGPEFEGVMGALYSFAYTIKMSYKAKDVPAGYYQYRVFPLEGVWDLGSDKTFDKKNFVYTVMIRQPDFVTPELFEKTKEQLKKKNSNPFTDKAVFGEITEGLCCQTMHIGSYDDEPKSFAKMEEFCEKNGLRRVEKRHREIYMSDPRRTETSKLKTVLRFKAEKI